MKYGLSLVTASFLFTGCFSNYEQPVSYEKYVLKNVRNAEYSKPYANTELNYQNLNGAIIAIADQLLTTNISPTKNTSIILTSFADLDKLNSTTTFGRLISESMFNELHVRKFKVTDFRGQDAISVNADGEFHITRDVDKLKDHIEATEYIVVGTYVKFEYDTILINARIIDSETGAIISTARVIYKADDCALFDMCGSTRGRDALLNNHNCNYPGQPGCNNEEEKLFGVNIVTDGCSKVSCPEQTCRDGLCNN
jgi:TolB-like protein